MLITADHCWSLMITDDHCWSLLIIDDHCWSLRITADHSRSLQISADHCWSRQITSDYNRLLQITEHNCRSLSNMINYTDQNGDKLICKKYGVNYGMDSLWMTLWSVDRTGLKGFWSRGREINIPRYYQFPLCSFFN